MKCYISFTPEEMKTDGPSKINQLTKIALEDESQVKIWSDGYCTIFEACEEGYTYEEVNQENGECVGVWQEDADGNSLFVPKED